jgi:hypothetical protein
MTIENLVIIQDALWSRMIKHGQFTKKDSLAMKALEDEYMLEQLRTSKQAGDQE